MVSHTLDVTPLNKRKEADVNFIPLTTNEAYATTDVTRGNIAYCATATTNDYEEYTYI